VFYQQFPGAVFLLSLVVLPEFSFVMITLTLFTPYSHFASGKALRHATAS